MRVNPNEQVKIYEWKDTLLPLITSEVRDANNTMWALALTRNLQEEL